MSPDRYPFLSGIEDLIVGNNISISLYPGQSILKFLSFGYIAVLLVGLVFSDRNKLRNKIYYYFVFIVFFFLLMRLTPPFNIINEYIYRIPGFSIFRMPEKLFIFLPCIFLFFLIYLLNNSSLSKKVIYFLLIFLLIIPIPFYTGGISKFLTAKINSAYGFSYSYAIKLPDEYNSIRENIYYDKSITRVIELPYSDAVNWKIYPELGYVGHHMIYIENSLHSKSSVSADAADHVNLETRFSFKDYNDAGIVDTGQFLSIIQKFSGKYIILHKDVKTPYELKDSATFKTLEKMQQDKMITKLEDNRYISIYRLDDRYVYPMISAESHKIYFQKISPVKYKVIITGLRTVTDLGFNSSYDSQWKLYVDSISDDSIIKKENSIYYKSANVYEDNRNGKFFEPEDLTFLFKGSKFDNTHIMVKDYANSWEIDPEFIKENFPNDYYKVNEDGSISAEFTIYYKPQIYFETGFVAVVLVLAGMLVYLLVKQKKKSRTTIL